MKTRILIVTIGVALMLLFVATCVNNEPGIGGEEDVTDVYVDTEDVYDDVIDDVVGLEDTYAQDCYVTLWYFCPPLDEIWRQPITFDSCKDPTVVIEMGECEKYLECDPSDWIIGEEPCYTDIGYPGTLTVFCNKGFLQNGPCESPCFEEVCDYQDNDCDGVTDEGQLNACGICGVLPMDSCDGIDNNCNGAIDENLVQECATDCGVGIEYCVNGNWISCTAPQPAEEICDGWDNNCDGNVDEGLECECTLAQVGILTPCEEDPLICGQGFKTCECQNPPTCDTFFVTTCAAACSYYPGLDPSCDPAIGLEQEDEKCNNFDDDCDQLIDEELVAACYSGPEETLNVGLCQPGEFTCKAGQWGTAIDNVFKVGLCDGEITPEEEDHCNGTDEDCDGLIDDGKELEPSDILFIVDWSGSMVEEIGAVIGALGMFSSNYSDEEVIHWGLVAGPSDELDACVSMQCPADKPCYEGQCLECGDSLQVCSTYSPGEACYKYYCSGSSWWSSDETLVIKIQPSPFQTFISVLMSDPVDLKGGSEMLYDAIYLSLFGLVPDESLPYKADELSWDPGVSSSPELPSFLVSWRENTKKIIIVFSDEAGQSYLDPEITQPTLFTALAAAVDVKVFTFSKTLDKNNGNGRDWEPIALATGGSWFALTSDPATMYQNLVTIVDENVCL